MKKRLIVLLAAMAITIGNGCNGGSGCGGGSGCAGPSFTTSGDSATK